MNKLIVCDIDGTLLFMGGSGFTTHYSKNQPHPMLQGSADKCFEWHAKGYKILLTTGRPECSREFTEFELKHYGIVYDILIMGIGSGSRYIINDSDNIENPKCFAINVLRNTGIGDIDI
jgi:hypothetical protein